MKSLPVASLARVLVASTVLMLLTDACSQRKLEAPHRDISDLSQRINEFTIAFLKHVATNDTGNLILSPQSVYHGVAMCYVASGTETRAELAKAVRFPMTTSN